MKAEEIVRPCSRCLLFGIESSTIDSWWFSSHCSFKLLMTIDVGLSNCIFG
jgi:hypothetical protein